MSVQLCDTQYNLRWGIIFFPSMRTPWNSSKMTAFNQNGWLPVQFQKGSFRLVFFVGAVLIDISTNAGWNWCWGWFRGQSCFGDFWFDFISTFEKKNRFVLIHFQSKWVRFFISFWGWEILCFSLDLVKKKIFLIYCVFWEQEKKWSHSIVYYSQIFLQQLFDLLLYGHAAITKKAYGAKTTKTKTIIFSF